MELGDQKSVLQKPTCYKLTWFLGDHCFLLEKLISGGPSDRNQLLNITKRKDYFPQGISAGAPSVRIAKKGNLMELGFQCLRVLSPTPLKYIYFYSQGFLLLGEGNQFLDAKIVKKRA